MKFEFKMDGADELIRNLDDLAEHPESLLEGQTFEITQEVKCDHCGFSQEVKLPVKLLRVEGAKGHGPGGQISITCVNCGKLFNVTWDDVSFDIDIH